MTDKQTANADYARVEIITDFNRDWLKDFISDPERLLRINSLYEFDSFKKTGSDTWHMTGKSISSNQSFDVTFKAEFTNARTCLTWQGWLKTTTVFAINRNTLVITDDYSGVTKSEREERIAEVDNTITQWGNDIFRYLKHWKRWSWLPGWKTYMRRFWQKMKPMARRITFLLIALTAVEFIVFLFVFAIFWLERNK